jgi:hypothetical protein
LIVRADDGGVALEVHVGELGQGQVGQRHGLSAQLRLDHVAEVLERGGAGRERACGPAFAVRVVETELVLPGGSLRTLPRCVAGI